MSNDSGEGRALQTDNAGRGAPGASLGRGSLGERVGLETPREFLRLRLRGGSQQSGEAASSRGLAEQLGEGGDSAAACAVAGGRGRAAAESTAQEHLRNFFDVFELEREGARVLAGATAVDDASHDGFGVDPVPGVRNLEGDD